jgi:hypothetical protein
MEFGLGIRRPQGRDAAALAMALADLAGEGEECVVGSGLVGGRRPTESGNIFHNSLLLYFLFPFLRLKTSNIDSLIMPVMLL